MDKFLEKAVITKREPFTPKCLFDKEDNKKKLSINSNDDLKKPRKKTDVDVKKVSQRIHDTKQEIEKLKIELQEILEANTKHKGFSTDSNIIMNHVFADKEEKQQREKSKSTSSIDQDVSPKKIRHYDAKTARDYIKKQKEERKKLKSEEHQKITLQDLKKQKLQELHKKSLQLVMENVKRSSKKNQNNKQDAHVSAQKCAQKRFSNSDTKLCRRSRSLNRDTKLDTKFSAQDVKCRSRSVSRDPSNKSLMPSQSFDNILNKPLKIKVSRNSINSDRLVPQKKVQMKIRSSVNNKLLDRKSSNAKSSQLKVPQTETEDRNVDGLQPDISSTKHSEDEQKTEETLLESKPKIYSETQIKAVTKIQTAFRRYRKRKKFKITQKVREVLENKKPTFSEEVSGENIKKTPTWLLPPSTLPYPYNFISAVKRKLDYATQGMNQSIDIATQSSFQEDILNADVSEYEKNCAVKHKDDANLSPSKPTIIDTSVPKLKSPESLVSKKNTDLKQSKQMPQTTLNHSPQISVKPLKSKSLEDSDSDTTKNIPEISEEDHISKNSSKSQENKILKIVNNLRPPEFFIDTSRLLKRKEDANDSHNSSRSNRLSNQFKYPSDIDSILSHYSKNKKSHYSDDFNSVQTDKSECSIKTDIKSIKNEVDKILLSSKRDGISSNSKEVIFIMSERSENSDVDNQIETHSSKENSFISTVTSGSNIPNLVKPSVSLRTGKVTEKPPQKHSTHEKLETVKYVPSQETIKTATTQTQSNPNQIHLKFEAELHLMNSFNQNLQTATAIQKSVFGVQNKENQDGNQNVTIPQSEPKTTSKVLNETPFSTINFKRGCDFTNDMNFKSDLSSLNRSVCSADLEISPLKNSTLSTTVNSIVSKTKEESFVAKRNPFVKVSVDMFDQMIKDEDSRIEHLKAVLKIREKTLLDRTKGELAWLEIQKKQLRDCGQLNEVSIVKKKQRGLIIKLQQEHHEMQRLKQAQKQASNERKMVLNEQKNIMKLQLASNNIPTKIKRTSRSERRQSGPFKVYSFHTKTEEIQSETSVSCRSSVTEEFININSSPLLTKQSDLVTERSNLLQPSKKTIQMGKVKQSLLMKEAELQKRREEAESLLKWSERLRKEEMKVTELEKAANLIQLDVMKKPSVLSGAKLNEIWTKATNTQEKRFNENKKYSMSKHGLDKLLQNAKKIFKEIYDNSKQEKISMDSYASDFEIMSSIQTLDDVLESASNNQSIVAQINDSGDNHIGETSNSQNSVKSHLDVASQSSVSESSIKTESQINERLYRNTNKTSSSHVVNNIHSSINQSSNESVLQPESLSVLSSNHSPTQPSISEIRSERLNLDSPLTKSHDSKSISSIQTQKYESDKCETNVPSDISEKIDISCDKITLAASELAGSIMGKTMSVSENTPFTEPRVQERSQNLNEIHSLQKNSDSNCATNYSPDYSEIKSNLSTTSNIQTESSMKSNNSESLVSQYISEELKTMSQPPQPTNQSTSGTPANQSKLSQNDSSLQIVSELPVISHNVRSEHKTENSKLISELPDISKNSHITDYSLSDIPSEKLSNGHISDVSINTDIKSDMEFKKSDSQDERDQIVLLEDINDTQSSDKQVISVRSQSSDESNKLNIQISEIANKLPEAVINSLESNIPSAPQNSNTNGDISHSLTSDLLEESFSQKQLSIGEEIETENSSKVNSFPGEKEIILTESQNSNMDATHAEVVSNSKLESEIKTDDKSSKVTSNENSNENLEIETQVKSIIVEEDNILKACISNKSSTEELDTENQTKSVQTDGSQFKKTLSNKSSLQETDNSWKSNNLDSVTESPEIKISVKSEISIKSSSKSQNSEEFEAPQVFSEDETKNTTECISNIYDNEISEQSNLNSNSKYLSVEDKKKQSIVLENSIALSGKFEILKTCISDPNVSETVSLKKKFDPSNETNVEDVKESSQNYEINSEKFELVIHEIISEKPNILNMGRESPIVESPKETARSDQSEDQYVSDFEVNSQKSVEVTSETKSSVPMEKLQLDRIDDGSDSSLSSVMDDYIEDFKDNTEEKSVVKDENTTTGVSHIDVRKRVSEILADARGDRSPRLQDLYVTTYGVTSPNSSSPEIDSPGEQIEKKIFRKSLYGNEEAELLRKQIEIEQEIKQLELQQKENIPYCFMREIPNKPPPPYKPPVSSIVPAVTTIIPTHIDQVKTHISDAAAILFNAHTQGTLNEAFVTGKSNKINSSRFVFDLCKEIALSIYKTKNDDVPSWMKLRNRLNTSELTKPSTRANLESLMNRKVLQLLGFQQTNRKDNLIIRWSRKKRDHVDEILVLEAQAEESTWTNYDKDEITVKEILVREILDVLILETAQSFSDILKRKTS